MDSLTIIVPTRNRAELAEWAIRSVLDQSFAGHLIVSDNSAFETQAENLWAYCRAQNDVRLSYIRPPRSMSMTEHWEWVIHEALRYTNTSHFTFLTDRMMFKYGYLPKLLALAHPDKIVTYNHDRIDDRRIPIKLEQERWSGKLIEIKSEILLHYFSHVHWHPALPRMLNCLVPRAALSQLAKRFGSIFGSIAPDVHFGFRVLALFDSILYWDATPIFHYALNRSTGASVNRAEKGADAEDFLAHIEGEPNYLAPVPEFRTVMNGVTHEYNLVRQETNSPKFLAVDLPSYFQTIEGEIGAIEDEEQQARMRQLLNRTRVTGPPRRLPYSLPEGSPRTVTFNSLGDAIRYASKRERSRVEQFVHSIRGRVLLRTRLKNVLDKWIRKPKNGRDKGRLF